MLKKISSGLIVFGIVGLLFIKIHTYLQIKTNYAIISNIEYSGIYEYYVGYIKIPSINIEVPLVYGTSMKELDQNIVGISDYSSKEHLILAGHAISSVFQPLYYVTYGSIINIKLNGKYFEYVIDNIQKVNKFDLSIYNNVGLTLITCLNDTERLIVHAKTA